MNRNDFQQLADIRAKEAKVLLDNQCFDGAYYLLGYAVECALKSCISKQFKEHDFPELQTVRDSYTHSLDKLLVVAGLKQHLYNQWQTMPKLRTNWLIVTTWSEQARYQHHFTQLTTQDFYNAVTENQTGVLSWLKNFM
ncbi:MAG: DNA-binding protein [Gammaproteobacteria bacterium]|nr:MAG: DNA-binding protein [Gammaproteobacteria bacterium]RKZ42151.1 MAG: DNA-binding protein [Gammaproteobacteria bacterium]RKZ76080.1 MAG: DNA-binding protein [Gammaproteobacteria bacterium]